ncbi:hypothetical protein A33Q_2527 [Indibacter alkaliphilus LW1]|uniref:Uncharacterized protein n=2 Tax=Indibacter TaxID=647744 RepID=S2DAJ3_INDAL|nr:hypothetical protein A33Q_2527 [Indibacter alkaliphilus LW1]
MLGMIGSYYLVLTVKPNKVKKNQPPVFILLKVKAKLLNLDLK